MPRRFMTALLALALLASPARAGVDSSSGSTGRGAQIKDITTIEGVRDNPLVGYGVVVGLNRTGDSQQTVFSTQTLANLLQRMGVQVPATSIRVNNMAAVFVTAELPPFARPGMKIDVTVSSAGDAKSLAGGLLLMTPMQAADGNVYAVAQGPLTLGGYSAGANGNTKIVNHLTVGRIPEGGIVERDTALDLSGMTKLSLLLRDPDFSAARDMACGHQQGDGQGGRPRGGQPPRGRHRNHRHGGGRAGVHGAHRQPAHQPASGRPRWW